MRPLHEIQHELNKVEEILVTISKLHRMYHGLAISSDDVHHLILTLFQEFQQAQTCLKEAIDNITTSN